MCDYTRTSLISNPTRLRKKIESPFFKTCSFLACENESDGITEVVMQQKNVTDSKPIHIGITILQESKLMMLQFVDFLKEYLIPGSFTLVYTGIILNSIAINDVFFQIPIRSGLLQQKPVYLIPAPAWIKCKAPFCQL